MPFRRFVQVAVFAVLVLVPAIAIADPEEALATARADAIRGDLGVARTRAADRAVNGVTAAERAGALELLYVIDVWRERGAVSLARRDRTTIATQEWSAGFVAARARLVDGGYADALLAFDELFATAPDLVAAMRASVLRDLSREGLAHAPVAPMTPIRMPEAPRKETEKEKDVETESRWYGWQTLISDGVAIPMTFAAPPAGIAFYGVGGPIIHAVHGRFGAAAGSLGIRLGAPILGAFVGAGVDRCGTNCIIPTGLVVGGGLGIVTAIVIDAAVIAHEKVEREPAKAATITPSVNPRRGGADVGVAGTF